MCHDAGLERVIHIALGELAGAELHVVIHLERSAVGGDHLRKGLYEVNQVDEAVLSDSVPVGGLGRMFYKVRMGVCFCPRVLDIFFDVSIHLTVVHAHNSYLPGVGAHVKYIRARTKEWYTS